MGERVQSSTYFAGTEIMRVADLSKMEVRVKVNENDIVNVKVGDPVKISIDAYPDRKFNGVVREIGASADNAGATGQSSAASDQVTNFIVKIRVSDKDAALRPGMSATADIETQTAKDVVAIPIQSVTVRAEGGLSADELQKKNAKDAKERTGNDQDQRTEKADAHREREKLLRVVFVLDGDKVKLPEGRDRDRGQLCDRDQVRDQGRRRGSLRHVRRHQPHAKGRGQGQGREAEARHRRDQVGNRSMIPPPAPVESRQVRPVGPLVISIEGVTKLYQMGEETIHALRGVSLRSIETNTWRSWALPGRASRP